MNEHWSVANENINSINENGLQLEMLSGLENLCDVIISLEKYQKGF